MADTGALRRRESENENGKAHPLHLSMTSDYATSTGCPEPALRRIADAGFTHVHWCHQWNTDFLYDHAEICQIARWFKDFGLTLTDLHASLGVEKCWVSPREYEREAGVALVANRIAMTARLGGDVIIMHTGNEPRAETDRARFWTQLGRSLDALEPVARDHGVRIAIENTNDFPIIRRLLADHGPDYLGLCYDCGHGNMLPDGLGELEELKDRLIAVHLHDNDGQGDQHLPPFTATVDWEGLAKIMARSAYRKPVSMESSMHNSGITDEAAFLKQCHDAGTRLANLVEKAAVQEGHSIS